MAYTLINPAQTAAFARAQGKRAKTDPVDAQVLASFGESQQPEASPPPQEAQERLKALEAPGVAGARTAGRQEPPGFGSVLSLDPPTGVGQPGPYHGPVEPGD